MEVWEIRALSDARRGGPSGRLGVVQLPAKGARGWRAQFSPPSGEHCRTPPAQRRTVPSQLPVSISKHPPPRYGGSLNPPGFTAPHLRGHRATQRCSPQGGPCRSSAAPAVPRSAPLRTRGTRPRIAKCCVVLMGGGGRKTAPRCRPRPLRAGQEPSF